MAFHNHQAFLKYCAQEGLSLEKTRCLNCGRIHPVGYSAALGFQSVLREYGTPKPLSRRLRVCIDDTGCQEVPLRIHDKSGQEYLVSVSGILPYSFKDYLLSGIKGALHKQECERVLNSANIADGGYFVVAGRKLHAQDDNLASEIERAGFEYDNYTYFCRYLTLEPVYIG